jgi:hypothetical protein
MLSLSDLRRLMDGVRQQRADAVARALRGAAGFPALGDREAIAALNPAAPRRPRAEGRAWR